MLTVPFAVCGPGLGFRLHGWFARGGEDQWMVLCGIAEFWVPGFEDIWNNSDMVIYGTMVLCNSDNGTMVIYGTMVLFWNNDDISAICEWVISWRYMNISYYPGDTMVNLKLSEQ